MGQVSHSYQILLFSALYFSYCLYIANRRSFSNIIPYAVKDETLDPKSAGAILSALALAYSIGKFVSEILVDTYSTRTLHCAGIFFCGVANLLFSYSNNQLLFTALWFSNGLFQGLGWPTCGKLLQRWYPKHIFGTLWSLLSTSMNVAATMGPPLATLVVEQYGDWQWFLRLIGSSSIAYSAVLFMIISDSPSEDPEKSPTSATPKSTSNESFTAKVNVVIRSPYSYVCSLMFFVSIMTKVAFSDWGPLYLEQEKSATPTDTNIFNGFMEIGGLSGNIVSGVLTDILVQRFHKQSTPRVGHARHYVLIPLSFILAGGIHLFCSDSINIGSNVLLFNVLGFIIGFCIYATINLAGILSIENAAPNLTGAAHAITALWGNIGLTAGGLPLSYMATTYSWSTTFHFVESTVLILAAVLVICQFNMQCKIGLNVSENDKNK